MHDSLQYHFFFPGVFVALRVFHTASLQSVTAWAYDFAEPHSGAANRTSTTGTAMGAGCARTSTPTCVLLPRSVCPVGPLHSSSSRSSGQGSRHRNR